MRETEMAEALRAGSLFSGYGGLDLAVQALLGCEMVWHCEIDPSASQVLAERWPDAPNLGDITEIDWTTIEPVDVLTGGFPCQDISTAGRGAGIKEGTRSGLWNRYVDAIRSLRPRLVVVENVSALLFRGLDIVVGDLAEVGYDARWTSIRAADVGAPHRRERIFLVAWPANPSGERRATCSDGLGSSASTDPDNGTDDGERSRPQLGGRGQDAANTRGERRDRRPNGDQPEMGRPDSVPAERSESLGEPTRSATAAADPGSSGQRQRTGLCEGDPGRIRRRRPSDDTRSDQAERLDAATNPERGRVDPDGRVRRGTTPGRRATRQAGEPAGQAVALTADPVEDRASTHTNPDDERRDGSEEPNIDPPARLEASRRRDPDRRSVDDYRESVVDWGTYRPAIDRWATITERPAPDPVDDRGRLDPRFVEWMMGLPAGWATDLIPERISRTQALRMLGNGVVPLQALAALTWLLD